MSGPASHDLQQKWTCFGPLSSRPTSQVLANGGVAEKISGVGVNTRVGEREVGKGELAVGWWPSGGGGQGEGESEAGVMVKAVGSG